MSGELVDELDRIAEELGTNRSEIIREFCEEGVEAHKAFRERMRRDREARAYFAKYLVEKGLAKPHQVYNDSFMMGSVPSLWLKRVERKLGAAEADSISEKMAELMGLSDELAAYLEDDSE